MCSSSAESLENAVVFIWPMIGYLIGYRKVTAGILPYVGLVLIDFWENKTVKVYKRFNIEKHVCYIAYIYAYKFDHHLRATL